MTCALLLLGFVYLFLSSCYTVPWMGAMETPKNLVAMTGISPIPTEAPGLNGIPRELKPRENIQNPPPPNWCGFIDGDYSSKLTCMASDTCTFSNTAMGCCSGNGPCEFHTACAGYDETCGSDCKNDSLVLKCVDPSSPYCGTYSFYGGTYAYNCESYWYTYGTRTVSSAMFVDHYYKTAIGASYSPSTTSTSKTTETTSTSTGSNGKDPSSSLGTAAIGGIAAGAGLIICIFLGLLVWLCMRRRKSARFAASQQLAQHAPPTFNTQGGTPMQQHQQYQSVPQQDNSFQGNGQYQPTQGYFGGPIDPSKESAAYSHVSPIASPVASTVDPAARPFSEVSSQHPIEAGQTMQGQQHLSPPVPGHAGPLAGGRGAQDYYKHPQSPNNTEVDGTQGNPGLPHGSTLGVNEVDGTQGNPGVPYTQQHPGPHEMH